MLEFEDVALQMLNIIICKLTHVKLRRSVIQCHTLLMLFLGKL